MDKLYASLKDLAAERRLHLEDDMKLYMIGRDYDDIMQWINEREIVASSHELGVDFEHVTVSSFFACPITGNHLEYIAVIFFQLAINNCNLLVYFFQHIINNCYLFVYFFQLIINNVN